MGASNLFTACHHILLTTEYAVHPVITFRLSDLAKTFPSEHFMHSLLVAPTKLRCHLRLYGVSY